MNHSNLESEAEDRNAWRKNLADGVVAVTHVGLLGRTYFREKVRILLRAFIYFRLYVCSVQNLSSIFQALAGM